MPPVEHGAATRDALTNTLTRPAFLGLLHDCAARAAAGGEPFGVSVLDVDQLTNVNDRHGLAAGDRVLAGIARRALAELAQPRWAGLECTLARYDGDALVLLAQPADAARLMELAEALRLAIARKPLEDTTITVSIGVAQHRIGESVDELLARTERALHVAKQFGRDRVELAATPASSPRRASVRRLKRP